VVFGALTLLWGVKLAFFRQEKPISWVEQSSLFLDNLNISLVLLDFARSYVLDDIVKMAIATQLASI
jgi:hypothetical protein